MENRKIMTELAPKLCKRRQETKSLTFEVKPLPQTKEALLRDKVLENDQYNRDMLDILYPAMDQMELRLIKDAVEEYQDSVKNNMAAPIFGNEFYDNYLNLKEQDDDTSKKELETLINSEKDKLIKVIAESIRRTSYKDVGGKIEGAKALSTFSLYFNNNKSDYKNPEVIEKALLKTKGAAVLANSYCITRTTAIYGAGAGSLSERTYNNFLTFCENIERFKKIASESELLKDTATALADKGIKLNIEEITDADCYLGYVPQNKIDLYNMLIGGYVDENSDTHIKGLNSAIQEYNTEQYNSGFKKRLPSLKILNKQILAPVEAQYKALRFENDNDVYDAFTEHQISKISDCIEEMADFFSSIDCYDTAGIVLNSRSINSISNSLTGDWHRIESEWLEKVRAELITSGFSAEKAIIKSNKMFSGSMLSIDSINDVICNITGNDKKILVQEFIENHFRDAYRRYRLHEDFMLNESISVRAQQQDFIEYLKSVKELFSILWYFKGNTDNAEFIDMGFYATLADFTEKAKEFDRLFNAARSFILRKPGDIARKKQSCLGNEAFLAKGWTSDNPKYFKKGEQTFLIDGDKYYYAAFVGDTETVPELLSSPETEEEYYMKPVIMANSAKLESNIPRMMLQTLAVKAQFQKGCDIAILSESMDEPLEIPRETFEKYKMGMHTTAHYGKEPKEPVRPVFEKYKTEEQFKEALAKYDSAHAKYEKEAKEYAKKYAEFWAFKNEYIELAKLFIKRNIYFNRYDTSELKDAEEYANLKDFYSHLATMLYSITPTYVSKKQILKCVDEGSVYMFEITSKDLRLGKTKTPYTGLLRYLFAPENIENTSVKLNGKPSIFFRKSVLSSENAYRHEKGSMLINKKYIDDEGITRTVPGELYKKIQLIHNSNGIIKESVLTQEEKAIYSKIKIKEATHEIVKNNRYTRDCYMLTFSLTLNNDAWESCNQSLTDTVTEYCKHNPMNVLSVVRGERNLLYYMLMSSDGRVLEEKSLNIIKGQNYHDLLQDATRVSKEEQKSWENKTPIVNTKEGYLHTAISEIIEVALKNNALIAIESFNDSFIEKRTCIDNQVYQKFETMIKERLSRYTQKNISLGLPGSLINPVAFANAEFEGLMNGILLSINSAYTSSVCPISGFTNLFDHSEILTKSDILNFFDKFKRIRYNDEYNRFEFTFDYKDFNNHKKKWDINKLKKTEWTVVSDTDRYAWNAEEKHYEKLDITAEFSALLDMENVFNYADDLKPALKQLLLADIRKFYKYFRILMNNVVYCEKPFIATAAIDKTGMKYYDSRNAQDITPESVESLKAYLLGKKAILSLNKKLNDDKKISITTEEWLNSF